MRTELNLQLDFDTLQRVQRYARDRKIGLTEALQELLDLALAIMRVRSA